MAWLLIGVVLIVLGAVVLEGGAAAVVLAAGFVALFGAGVRLISRRDERPREEPRLPAGHSGV
jgi:uncharacterized membrane protein